MYEIEDYGCIADMEERGIRLIALVLLGDDGGVRLLWKEGTKEQREGICKLLGIPAEKCRPMELEDFLKEGD